VERDRGVKFCRRVRLLSGQSSPLLVNFGLRGVTPAALVPGCTLRHRPSCRELPRRRSVGIQNWMPWIGGAFGIGGGGVA